jgi:aldose 1-epimerase
MDDAIALVAGHARAEINPACGGALASFSFRGIDVLRPTPAGTRDVSLHACYPLVPYSNRIADALLQFEQRAWQLARNLGDHPHAIHGIGWHRPWTIRARDESSALLALDHDAGGEGAYAWPWPLGALQALSLRDVGDSRGAVLALKLTIANPGVSAFPFGLGWHPFFVRGATTELAFARAASGKPTRHDCPPCTPPFRRNGDSISAQSGKCDHRQRLHRLGRRGNARRRGTADCS